MNKLFSPIDILNGVGVKREKLLRKLNITTPYDLLYHIPRSYTDFSHTVQICDGVLDENNCIKTKIIRKLRTIITARTEIFKALCTDGEVSFEISIFGNKYLFETLTEGEEYYAYGKLSQYYDKFQLSISHIIPVTSQNLIQPVYPLTSGLTSAMLQTNVNECLTIAENELIDYMPLDILEKYSLCDLLTALRNVHFPISYDSLEMARKRLAFDELLMLQLGMQFIKYSNGEKTEYIMQKTDFPELFPFELTNAQKKAIKEISEDLCCDVPMNRLLQGDVGSGKTAVAAYAMYFAVKNNCQVAFMAPTEILAVQHYNTVKEFLGDKLRICLLTGALSVKEKNECKKAIEKGEYDVIIGTHALFQKSVEYKNLGLVIMDEQHRFGVAQRTALIEKGQAPHRLVMSATPIPRTLGLVLYGDLDITILDELPKNRLAIETFAVTGKLRQRAFGFIKKQLELKHQAYIVCPAIEESDDLKSVIQYCNEISQKDFRDYNVALLHGKLTAAQKDEVMTAFKNGETDILVATTVVEVGVDVPNSTIMIIENADRFGLSQLHQLRGRVGRGKDQSYCVLVTDNPSEEVRDRLKIFCKLTDGFKIAEEDLKQRGPGDFFGKEQHGLPKLKIADIASDMELVNITQTVAKDILTADKTLEKHHALKIEVMRMTSKMKNG
ncbi:MAG: ATP-dependent DNA helicase RecG [Oscillospiraceae bacterium]|jgi:ATP-dependent DNA helicase RecG|nr:ATP-dependent DNA helicase RecG [Oscillospiraceae bacterium]